MSMPQQQDAFGGSLAQKLWPGSGVQGAMTSPYLPIVQPLMQGYENTISSLAPQSQSLGPVSIQQAPATPGQSGKGPSGVGALMGILDPAGGKMFGAI
jgi:hypothetical protein